MRKTFCVCVLFVTSLLSASTILQYEISSIQANIVTLSNRSTFDVDFKDFVTLQGWHVGDFVELVSTNEILFTAHLVKIIEGRIVICPVFLLRNLTKNDERVVIWLQQPPTTPDLSTFYIASIDSGNRVITLSNSTSWAYSQDDQHNVGFWKIGDVIMLGANGVFPPSHYDAVLLNTNQQSMIRVIQQ